jgi:sugar-specific transcriptional regulator TrmB
MPYINSSLIQLLVEKYQTISSITIFLSFVNFDYNNYVLTDNVFVILNMTKMIYSEHMDETLLQLGLNDKEAAVYLYLLKHPYQSAHQVANACNIQRTNIYRLLEVLEKQELVVHIDNPVRSFSAAEPQALRRLLEKQNIQLKQASSALTAAMPQFRSQYSLSLDKPGVFYMSGDAGIEQLLTDMVNSGTEVLLVASDNVPGNQKTLDRFRELISERKKAGVKTRALFHHADYSAKVTKQLETMGMEVRLIGTNPFLGEVVIYEDNVVFTVYEPSVSITVITNDQIASTMRLLFDELWQKSSRK